MNEGGSGNLITTLPNLFLGKGLLKSGSSESAPTTSTWYPIHGFVADPGNVGNLCKLSKFEQIGHPVSVYQ